jgi:RecA-family ATPase
MPSTSQPRQSRAGGNGGQRQQRFIGRMWQDIKPNFRPNYLVKGILPRDGLAVVWGAKKSGKSFWTFDLIMHVVTGRPYRGRKVRQGSVVYIALEGSSGFDNRVEAWRQRY